LTVEVKSLPHLTRVFKHMKDIKDVIHVERLDDDGSHDR
jgi:(p)ppGpp synthase/HD superfamily hydrolase